MLNIICLNAANYLGRGTEYVNILASMVARNISDKTTYKFICFTDTSGEYDPEIDIRPLPVDGLDGWWNKLALFKGGVFPEGDRILFLDLDTVITSGLDEIIKYDGEFAILRDFYRPDGLQSSVMAWKAGTHTNLWRIWAQQYFPKTEYGDQVWLEHVFHTSGFKPDIWQDLYPDCFVSYKLHAQREIPKSAKMVIFHGLPRPHEIVTGWMSYVWKIGGGTVLELTHQCNTEENKIAENIKNALRLPLPWIEQIEEHDGHAVIVGGGPSLKDDIQEIRERQKHGQVIFSTNNTFNYLAERDIYADCHIMLDARQENKDFVPAWGFKKLCYYASQVHPECIEKASKNSSSPVLWHSFFSDGIFDIIGDKTGDPLVGGGSTVGLQSMALAWILGYRKFHLYGFDSSYQDGENHAYKQPLNNNEYTLEVEMNGNKYKAAAWMCEQVEKFKDLAKEMVKRGCIITVHGSGLLPDVAKLMSLPDVRDTEMVQVDGTWWPSKCKESRLNAEFTFNDINTVISKCGQKRTAIQAGGNVGIWPREFSKHFEKVISFEPDELNFECMVKNLENIENVEIYNTALGNSLGSAALERVSYNCGAHYLRNGSEFHIMTIDSLDLDACDLIQLDVEGYELNALKGAQKTIDAFRPVIMVEDKGLSNRYGSCKGDIEKWLQPLGYIAECETARDIIFVHK